MSLNYLPASFYTDIATINFQAPSISFQRAYPIISFLRSAIIISPSVYYAGGFEFFFYTDQTTVGHNINNV